MFINPDAVFPVILTFYAMLALATGIVAALAITIVRKLSPGRPRRLGLLVLALALAAVVATVLAA